MALTLDVAKFMNNIENHEQSSDGLYLWHINKTLSDFTGAIDSDMIQRISADDALEVFLSSGEYYDKVYDADEMVDAMVDAVIDAPRVRTGKVRLL